MQILVFIFSFLFVPHHHTHYSVTTIDFLTAEKKLNIGVRLSCSDFEFMLAHKYSANINFEKQIENTENEQIIKTCIFDYLKITLNNKMLKTKNVKFIKKEKTEHELFLYFECTDVAEFSEIVIENQIFFDLYPDQKNMLIFTKNEKQFSKTFTIKNKVEKINL